MSTGRLDRATRPLEIGFTCSFSGVLQVPARLVMPRTPTGMRAASTLLCSGACVWRGVDARAAVGHDAHSLLDEDNASCTTPWTCSPKTFAPSTALWHPRFTSLKRSWPIARLLASVQAAKQPTQRRGPPWQATNVSKMNLRDRDICRRVMGRGLYGWGILCPAGSAEASRLAHAPRHLSARPGGSSRGSRTFSKSQITMMSSSREPVGPTKPAGGRTAAAAKLAIVYGPMRGISDPALDRQPCFFLPALGGTVSSYGIARVIGTKFILLCTKVCLCVCVCEQAPLMQGCMSCVGPLVVWAWI